MQLTDVLSSAPIAQSIVLQITWPFSPDLQPVLGRRTLSSAYLHDLAITLVKGLACPNLNQASMPGSANTTVLAASAQTDLQQLDADHIITDVARLVESGQQQTKCTHLTRIIRPAWTQTT